LKTRVGDSQGSFLIEGELARKLFQLSSEPGFLAQTEIVALAELAGIVIIEVPVRMEDKQALSSVRPIHTSLRMLYGLIRLRSRYPKLRKLIKESNI
jgi:hypothetical protein